MPQATTPRTQKRTRVSIKPAGDGAFQWSRGGMWLTSVGERLSLFYGDDLSVKVPQENYPRLYKLLSGLWPHADVDHIIVDQKTGRLASFQLQYKADMSVSSLAAESLIKAAVSNCNGPDTR